MIRKLSLVFLIAILILTSFISGAVSYIEQEAVENETDLYGNQCDEKALELKLPEKEEMNRSDHNFLSSDNIRTSNEIKDGLSDTPWPKFRGNQKNTGLSPYRTDQIDGAERWTFSTDGDIKSSPAVGENGTIYFGSSDGTFYALNWNGSKRWSYKIGDQIRSSPAIGSDGTIYVGSADGNLYSIYPNGTEKWKFETGDRIRSSPTIGDEDTIYLGSGDGNLYAINPNGGEKWKFETDRKIVSSPAIGEDGTIYFGSRDQNMYAVYPNGTKRWSYDADGEIDSSPAIGPGGKIYVGTYGGSLYAFKSHGNKSWKFEIGDQIRSSPAIAEDGEIYIGSNNNNIYAIDSNGTEKWSFETGDQIRSSPVIGSNGTIYAGSWDHNLYAIYPNGTEKWSFQTGNRIRSSPAVGIDRTLYLGSNDDNLYAITETKKLSTDSNQGGRVIKPGENTSEYAYGEKVYLEANADENWTFVEWIGDNETIKDKESNMTTVKILDDYSIKAKFRLKDHNLTLNSSEGGKVIEPSQINFEYEHGKTVDIVAEPEENYTFQGWIGDNETIEDFRSKATTIEMLNDYEVKAVFVKSAFFKLEIASIEEGDKYVEGELITIDYTVKNVGALNDTQTIELLIDGEVIKSKEEVKLEEEGIANFTFTWYAEKPYGERIISLKSQNYTDETAIQILEKSYFEVDITSPKDDDEFTEEDNVEIEYLVENTGDLKDTQAIELLVGGQLINKKEEVTLGGGKTQNYSFSWTTETPSDETMISVRSNDTVDNVTVEVLEDAHFVIDKFSSGGDYVDGNTVKIDYIVKNIGEEKDTKEVKFLVYNENEEKIYEETEEVTLDGGDKTNRTFTWTIDEPGEYEILLQGVGLQKPEPITITAEKKFSGLLFPIISAILVGSASILLFTIIRKEKEEFMTGLLFTSDKNKKELSKSRESYTLLQKKVDDPVLEKEDTGVTSGFKVDIRDYDEKVKEGERVKIDFRITNKRDIEFWEDVTLTVYQDGDVVYEDTIKDINLESEEEKVDRFIWETEGVGEYDCEIKSEKDEEKVTVKVVEVE